MRSPRFLLADGGWNRIVWMPAEIRERIKDYMPPEIILKIATENDVKSLDELKAFLKTKEHPIIKTWIETSAAATPENTGEITVPTLELPGDFAPIQGLPAGMSFKIILKNAKIKAEKMIIKAEKR
jgi:acetyl-CoA decarbonylase/synthase complex subunit beta